MTEWIEDPAQAPAVLVGHLGCGGGAGPDRPREHRVRIFHQQQGPASRAAVCDEYGRCGSRFHGERAWNSRGARQPHPAGRPVPHDAGCCCTARWGRAQQVSRFVSMDAVTVPFAFTVTCIRMCCLPSDPSEPCRTMLSATVMVFGPPSNCSVKWPV